MGRLRTAVMVATVLTSFCAEAAEAPRMIGKDGMAVVYAYRGLKVRIDGPFAKGLLTSFGLDYELEIRRSIDLFLSGWPNTVIRAGLDGQPDSPLPFLVRRELRIENDYVRMRYRIEKKKET